MSGTILPSVTIVANFAGANYHTDPGDVVTPPNADGAVGAGYYAQLLNNLFTVYDLSGNAIEQERLTTFWADAGATYPGLPFDPHILYDPYIQRWIASSAYSSYASPSGMLLAVSNTSDPAQGWTDIPLPTDPDTERWTDYPRLGIDTTGIYLAANQFNLSNVSYAGTDFIEVPLSDITGGTITTAGITLQTGASPVQYGDTPDPVAGFYQDGAEPVLAFDDYNNSGQLRISQLVESGQTGFTLGPTTTTVQIPAYAEAQTATQKGTSILLDLRNTSQFGPTVTEQDGDLFAVRTVFVNGYDAIAWYVIGAPLSAAPTLLGTGLIAPPDMNAFEGSIAVNPSGDVVVGFTGAGPNDYPSAFAAAGTFSAASGQITFGDPILLAAGAGPYLGTDGEQGNGQKVVRWGDYSATTVDPDNPNDFWTTQETDIADPALTTLWSTQITELQITVCFAAGTRIATAQGERKVETIRAGDAVVAADAAGNQRMATVRWVGRRLLDLRAHPDPTLAAPVRIRAGAIAPGLPARDVVVSPDHCVLLDGHLLRAWRLINGVSVVQERPASVEYLHVELDRHALLLAGGLPVESYLDEGNRGFFTGEDARPGPLGERTRAACAPFAPDDDFAARIWLAVAARAGMQAPQRATRQPALRLVAGGRVLRPVCASDRRIFALPPRTSRLRLVCAPWRPTDRRPWVGDRRRLGVPVRGLVFDGEHAIPLDAPTFGAGWHASEPGPFRWTTGDGHLAVPDGALSLEVRLRAG